MKEVTKKQGQGIKKVNQRRVLCVIEIHTCILHLISGFFYSLLMCMLCILVLRSQISDLGSQMLLQSAPSMLPSTVRLMTADS